MAQSSLSSIKHDPTACEELLTVNEGVAERYRAKVSLHQTSEVGEIRLDDRARRGVTRICVR